jgi:hypothetical protein
LNKHWRALTVDEYLHKMDIPATNNAVIVSCFPENIIDWIWEEEKKVGAHFTKTSRVI